MTDMSTAQLFSFPNPNDPHAIEAHKGAVLDAFAGIFALINASLEDSLPKARTTFDLFNGPVDLAVHAPITRYLVKQYLAERNTTSNNEEDQDFELPHVPNCGLCVVTDHGEIRILKTTVDGVPKAFSKARMRFYSSNQMVFDFDGRPNLEIENRLLSLVILWEMDSDHKYVGMEIGCPRRTLADGSVDCFWIEKWDGSIGMAASETPKADGPDSDLEEIQPIEAVKVKKE
jgi:hypothetical protein